MLLYLPLLTVTKVTDVHWLLWLHEHATRVMLHTHICSFFTLLAFKEYKTSKCAYD